MVKLEQWHIIEYREPTRETATDWEQEVVFADVGRNYRVTVYASTNYGPHSFTYTIDDDDTGDGLFDSRVAGRTYGEHLRVNLALIGQLASDLYAFACTGGCTQCGDPSQGCEFCAECYGDS